jgi:putative sigma-54 modulation protein
MDVTNAIREYVESKASRLRRFYNGLHSIEVILDVEAEKPVVEIVVTASRKSTFVATHRDNDMYACVDQCLQKISEQLRRHKGKVRHRQGAPHNQIREWGVL